MKEISSPDPHPDSKKTILALSSHFEGSFSLDWILDLTDLKPTTVLAKLEEGVEQGLLIKENPGLFIFKDRDEKDRIYAHVDSEEKVRLHKVIAMTFLREAEAANGDLRPVLHHFLRISNDKEGCRLLLKASDLYRKDHQYSKAQEGYKKALQDLKRINDSEAKELFTQAAIGYSNIIAAMGGFDTPEAAADADVAASVLDEALIKAEQIDDQSSRALLELHLATMEWVLGNYDSALSHFDRGWTMAEGIREPELKQQVNTFGSFFFLWQGRYRDVILNYEKFMLKAGKPDVEKYPKERFPLLSKWAVGTAYAFTGQIAQGMGMLDAIYTYCRNNGDDYIASVVSLVMGYFLCEAGLLDEALEYLKDANKRANRISKSLLISLTHLVLASVYYRKKDINKAIDYMDLFLQERPPKGVDGRNWTSNLWELCWAMDQGKLPTRSGFSLDEEIHRGLRSNHLVSKGLAYRYKALTQRRDNEPSHRIFRSLVSSIKWLEESGYQMELAQSRLELSRQYLLQNDQVKARKAISKSVEFLDNYSGIHLPEDLRFLLKDLRTEKNLLKEIMKLGHELVTIRDNHELIRTILSTVNHITGAERGGIFLPEKDTSSLNFALRASINLTADDVDDPRFADSMVLIREAIATGKGRIKVKDTSLHPDTFSREIIRSCICVPMKFRNTVVGVLYHDNRLFSSTFKESDLMVLDYFAALAAIALDNAKAYEEIQVLNQKLKQEKKYIEEQHIESLHFGEFIGKSPAIKRVLSHIEQVAGMDANVLILGETGVGKELVARAIHSHSHRRDKPFIQVNCSALPETLITSELFGHEKGAFTGATGRRIGRFELADEGTLFLDEVGDIPLEVQVRLLRVLQTKEFERVGGKEVLRSDFRLIAATNRDLNQAVKTKNFREDLYYRLNVFPIHIPPLRERKEDITLLANHFLEIHSKKAGKQIKTTESDMEKLLMYDWPGNVRELENVIERGVILSSGPRFKMPELIQGLSKGQDDREEITLKENERRHILWALQRTIWKVEGKWGAAELLDIHPRTLYHRMEKLGIRRPQRSLRTKN